MTMTRQELNKVAEMNEIADLKRQLADTDYKAIKHSEGLISDEDYEAVKEQREAIRQRIRELGG